MAYESINPYNGKTVKKFAELNDSQLEQKIATATKTYESWKKTPYAKRAVIVAKAAELMHAQVDKFAHSPFEVLSSEPARTWLNRLTMLSTARSRPTLSFSHYRRSTTSSNGSNTEMLPRALCSTSALASNRQRSLFQGPEGPCSLRFHLSATVVLRHVIELRREFLHCRVFAGNFTGFSTVQSYLCGD